MRRALRALHELWRLWEEPYEGARVPAWQVMLSALLSFGVTFTAIVGVNALTDAMLRHDVTWYAVE